VPALGTFKRTGGAPLRRPAPACGARSPAAPSPGPDGPSGLKRPSEDDKGGLLRKIGLLPSKTASNRPRFGYFSLPILSATGLRQQNSGQTDGFEHIGVDTNEIRANHIRDNDGPIDSHNWALAMHARIRAVSCGIEKGFVTKSVTPTRKPARVLGSSVIAVSISTGSD